MRDKVLELINKRNEFLTLLNQDIEKNDETYNEIKKSLKQVEQTFENIKELGKKPEHNALIPLCKNLYIPGKIIHTGEYLVTIPAHPNSYSVLKTLDQTIKSLEQQIQEQKRLLEKAEVAKSQLYERKKILYGDVSEELQKVEKLNLDEGERNYSLDSDDDDLEDEEQHLHTADLPKEIFSDKGVAVKVGDFFEILEYEEN